MSKDMCYQGVKDSLALFCCLFMSKWNSWLGGSNRGLYKNLPKIGTIPELIPPLLYIQNLHSSHAFKYPPSCFNLLVTPLKM